MVQYVITPWRNRAELLQLRAKLYPEAGKCVGEGDKRHAVAKVAVWVQRGNCPHLVESTAILTEAILNDVRGNSTYCVKAAYSAAFCR
jgi:ribosomal biogenesis protein LAS1